MNHSIRDRFDELVGLADKVLSEYSFCIQSDTEKDDERLGGADANSVDQLNNTQKAFSSMGTGKDYAFRVLSDPANQKRFIDELHAIECISLTTDEEKATYEFLDTLARQQNTQSLMNANYDETGYWDELRGELAYFYATGKVCGMAVIDHVF